jgi:hypothetical protein
VNRERLAAVLRVRALQERGARGELSRRREAERAAQDAELHTWRSLQRSELAAVGGALGLGGLAAVRGAGLLAAERQHELTVAAAEQSRSARDEWVVAARRVEGLERLGERLREADLEEEERRSLQEIDDLVLARRGRIPGGAA